MHHEKAITFNCSNHYICEFRNESTPSQPIVNLATSNNQSVSFSVEFCGMYKNDIIVDNKLFQRISIQSCGKTNIEKIFFISQGFV